MVGGVYAIPHEGLMNVTLWYLAARDGALLNRVKDVKLQRENEGERESEQCLSQSKW